MTRPAAHVCGFCQTGHHNLCPTAVRNGNGTPISCPCECWDGQPKCMDCKNNTPGEVDDTLFTCTDVEACHLEQQTRRAASPIYKFMEEYKAARRVAEAMEAHGRYERTAVPKAAGQCLCCGGDTKGGSFLPGHDARWIKTLAAEVFSAIDAGDPAAEVADTERRVLEQAAQVSPALEGKLRRKLSAAKEKAA